MRIHLPHPKHLLRSRLSPTATSMAVMTLGLAPITTIAALTPANAEQAQAEGAVYAEAYAHMEQARDRLAKFNMNSPWATDELRKTVTKRLASADTFSAELPSRVTVETTPLMREGAERSCALVLDSWANNCNKLSDELAQIELDYQKSQVRDELTNAYAELDKAVSDASGRTLDELAQATELMDQKADYLNTDSTYTLDQLKMQLDQVKDATTKLTEALAAQIATESVRTQAASYNSYASEAVAQSVAAGTGATPYKGDDGVWHLQYYNDYGAAEGDANGALTQWADGYYVAHNWSSNGKKISSQPEYVEIDGKTYKFAGSREVSRDSYYEDVEGWVHQNGGIGMQTCIDGGGYLINHYEPVN